MKFAVLFPLALVLALPVAAIAAEAGDERGAWRAEIAVARTRAAAQRAELKAEARAQEDRAASPSDRRPRVSSASARDTLRSKPSATRAGREGGYRLPLISGLFVFIGDPEGERTPADFAPLSK